MHRAIKVKPMENYLLLIKFDNGEERIYNCFPLLGDALYSKIRDKNFFASVHIDDMGIVCWDDATDISPYELYDNSEEITKFAFAS